jgi:excisionase family DNA binding protein
MSVDPRQVLGPVLAAAVEALVAEHVEQALAGRGEQAPPSSPYLSVAEAAACLRCERHRIDDLLSQRRLTRVKDGSRTLVLRSEIEEHLVRQPRRRP